MKRIPLAFFAVVLCLLLALPAAAPARAEDCFTLDIDTLDLDRLNSDDYVAQALSSGAQGIRVRKYISDSSELAAPVRLTLRQMNTGSILFDKDYGYQSHLFDSGVLYLPYAGDGVTPYLVTLYVGDYVYALPFMHQQRRLQSNGACTVGPRLRDLDASLANDWFMGTMVDLNELRGGSMSVDLCASNSYLIGTAYLSMSGDSLCVQVDFADSAQVEISQQTLYVVTDCRAFGSAPAHAVGEWVDVGGASSALIYLPMQLSYDPAGLPGFSYDASSSSVQRQISLWNENCSAGGGQEAFESDGGWTGDSWNDNGWTDDGWDENYGWDDGWASDAEGWE